MTPSDVTMLLQAAGAGDDDAYDRLIPILYEELKRVAQGQLRRERSDHTLQPTELVSEAYLRLVAGAASFENRAHFFGAASIAMRRILVDHARQRAAQKRGGELQRVTFADLAVETDEPNVDLLALDQALNELESEDERLAQLVQLRFFAGLPIRETAELMGLSPATVKRDWAFARAWLLERMD